MTIRIVLADDQGLFRSTLRLLVDTEPDLEVVAEATNGGEAVRAARRFHPDVVVADLQMPGIDGIAATRSITSDPLLRGTRVMVLTTFEYDDNVAAALRAGAGGFIGKDASPQELLDAIRAVAQGDTLMSPAATQMLVSHFLSRPSAGPGVESAVVGTLTPREREVVVLVAEGFGNAEIADRLQISVLTAKTHVNRAMTKFGARDRSQLVVAAYECGLVVPGRRPVP